MPDKSPEELAEEARLKRAKEAHDKFVVFLDRLEELAETDKQLASGEVAQFVGYPFWLRLVYCSTKPLTHILKETQNFQSLPAPVTMLELHKHIRELLDDTAFCAFVQEHTTKHARRAWLEHSDRKSTKSGFTFVRFAGRLTRLPSD